LNDPYKRDRIDGVCMWICLFFVFLARRVAPRLGLRELKVKKGHFRDIGVLRGITLILGILWI
jgi:hypothetical protein